MDRSAHEEKTRDRWSDYDKTVVADVGSSPDPKPPIQISNLPAILWRRAWLIVLAIALCMAAAVVYLRQATPIFQATNKLFVTKIGDSQIFGESAEVQALARGANYRATQLEILQSPLVLRKVVERPDIRAMKTFGRSENVLAILRSGMQAQFGGDDLMNISFTTPVWSDAAPIANAIADAYIAFSDDYKKSSSAEVLQILQKEKLRLEDELSDRLATLTKFKMESGGLALATRDKQGNTVLQGSTTLKQLDTFTETLTRTQIDAIEAKANLESIRNLKSDPARLHQYMETQRARGWAATGGPDESRMRNDLAQLYVARREIETRLAPAHPRYQAVVQSIAGLEQELAKYDVRFVDNQVSMAEEAYNATARRVVALQEYIRANSEEARNLNTQVARFDQLSAELTQTQARLDALNARIRERGMSQDVRAMNVMQVEAAVAPGDPISPNSGKILKMALAFGLILGLTLAVMFEFVDDRMRSADQVTAATGLALLGMIPQTDPVQGQDVARSAETEPKSAWAEAVRTCRTAVLFGMPEGHAKVVMLTSPSSGDGKSTVSASLAISMAQAGQRTVILNADMREPRMASIFAIKSEPGLSSLITGQATLEEIIQKSPVDGLDLIGCGPIPPNPAELLNSQAFRELITILANQYDRILIDTPPVLVVTDARIVASCCDVSILVLRADYCRQRSALDARDALRSVGAHVLGVIMNGVPPRGRYGGYSDGYYYGNKAYGYTYGSRASAEPTVKV